MQQYPQGIDFQEIQVNNLKNIHDLADFDQQIIQSVRKLYQGIVQRHTF